MKQKKRRKSKKIVAVLLAVMTVVLSIPTEVFAASPGSDGKKEGYLEYSVSYTQGTVIDGVLQADYYVVIEECDTEAEGDFIIPETIEGKPVKIIMPWAFQDCEKITSITIPKSVILIHEFAFAGCSNLERIIVDNDNEKYMNDENGILFTKDKSAILQYPIAREQGIYNIPQNVLEIKSGAFKGCENLIEVTVPDSVAKIGASAFDGCKNLVNVNIPESVISIGREAFSSCESIKNITIPNSVIAIGEYAFKNCKNLTSIAIPKSITTIEGHTFYGCEKLVDVAIPNSVTAIGEHAFYCCDALSDITIPNSVISIGDGAFESCDTLSSITIPESVISLGNRMFAHCEKLSSVTLPKGMTTIPVGMFEWCSSLESFTVQDSVTTIGNGAFWMCSKLSNISIPEGVTSIGFEAFRECKSLKTIDIPNSVTSMGEGVFKECNLETIIIGDGLTDFTGFEFTSSLRNLEIGNGITKLSGEQFEQCSSLEKISIGSSVNSINIYAFNTCSSLERIIVVSNNASYSSDDEGILYNKEKTRIIKYPAGKKIAVYEIGDTVTTIGTNAFMGNDSLTSIIMSDNVTAINGNAFRDCSSLSNITLSDNLEYLEGESVFENTAFYNDEANWSEGGLYIDNWYICPKNNNNKHYVIEDGTEHISAGAISGCRSLVSIVIPNSMKNINGFSTWWLGAFETVYFKGTEEEWSCIEKDEENFEGIEIVYNYVDLVSNNVGISATKNEIDTTAEFKVTLCDNEDIEESVSIKVEENCYISNFKLYNICLIKEDEYIQPNGNVKITFFIPNDVDEEKCRVYYIDELGNVVEQESTFEDGYVILKTNRLGYYAVAEIIEGKQEEENKDTVVEGWIKDSVGWWYQYADGSYPQNSWREISSEWYYFNSAGYMVTGWVNDGGIWYYMDASGAMATGWINDGGIWYYMNASGAMATGWVNDGGIWYYMDASGAMATGWVNDGGTWYYMDASGAMVTNQWIGNYYLQSDGSMATNKWIGVYYVGADGVWIP